jgi:uncharacterized phiE125 gp8 family phage protein
MILNVTTAPATEPVSLAEAKIHLRVDHDADDALITSLIKTAREWCESYSGNKFITQTLTLKLHRFENVMRLPYIPASTLKSFQYVDTAGTTQTVSSDVYVYDTDSKPAQIRLAYNQTWPTPRADNNVITIVYDAGYGVAAAVPDVFKAAIFLVLAAYYEGRDGQPVKTDAAERLLMTRRSWT